MALLNYIILYIKKKIHILFEIKLEWIDYTLIDYEVISTKFRLQYRKEAK